MTQSQEAGGYKGRPCLGYIPSKEHKYGDNVPDLITQPPSNCWGPAHKSTPSDFPGTTEAAAAAQTPSMGGADRVILWMFLGGCVC